MDYEAKNYLEYFEIDEGYYPEINESSIKDPKNKWQSTFPHQDVAALLRLTARTLSRQNKASCKSIWLEGSYGTGKSRILWMLRNLLTCSEAEFEAYFDEYDNLRGDEELRDRLRAERRGKIVAAARYATGDITSTQKLIFAVFESLSAALRKKGCKFDGAKTLRGRIANWLESDRANLEMFRAKIRKPEYRMSVTLSGRSAEEIIARLKNPTATVTQLVEEILALGEKEGIRAFNIDMRDLIEWITEVVEENDLKAIVLFWDEFSRFFGNNRNNLDEFQRLAELSNTVPFYLVIATHQSESLAGEGDQTFRSVSDRFNHMNITMPDNIALELIGHALKVKDDAKEKWANLIESLANRTVDPRKVVLDFIKSRDDKLLTNVLPIHPMSAVLLKNLASYFASNQRSIFNFIKNSDPNIKAFQDFIATRSPDNGDLLTIDCLWNFFYESGTDEHGSAVGRMNLKDSIRAILDSYALNKKKLSADEQAVFKTILLFQAIDLESRGEVGIFRPTEENLELAFAGVDSLDNGRAKAIANELVRREILFKKPGRPGEPETFAAMSLSGDFAEIERLKKEQAAKANTFEFVLNGELIKAIPLTAAQRARYTLNPVATDNFTRTIKRLTDEADDYRIKTVVCFARNDEERSKIHELVIGAIRDERYHKLAIIDASANVLAQEILDRWIDNTANERYWRGKDNALADKMSSNAADCLKEWRNTFDAGSFVYYPSTTDKNEWRRGISCQGADRITGELKDNVRRLYPYSFDDAQIAEALWSHLQLKSMAEAGIKRESKGMLTQKSIESVFGDACLSRLKRELDELIEKEIEKNVRVSFDDIFAYLLERGFMPLNIYAALTGFLLKEYAAEPYRYSAGLDGNSGGAMSVSKLAECISESIRQASPTPARSYRPKYLEIMSHNQRQFMMFAAEIFGVAEDVSVEQSAQKLRLKLQNLGYPLWCYTDAAEARYKDFLRLLADVANSKEAVSVSALAERAGQFLTGNPIAFDDMKKFLTPQNGREFFTDFVREIDGGIIFKLAQAIGVDDPVEECQRRVTSGDGIWLRDKETAEDDLRKLIVDYRIVAESRKFGIEGRSLKECVKKWGDYCRYELKVPADVLGDYYPLLKSFFAALKEMLERGEIAQSKREYFLLRLIEDAEIIREAISEPLKVLKAKDSRQLEGLNDAEIKEVHARLPNSSFTDPPGRYHQKVGECAKEIKSRQLKNKLTDLWREMTGTGTPREWSKNHRTPILAMVPQSESDEAAKIFETIMSSAPDEKSVEYAIAYLQRRPSYFDELEDREKIEANFREKIIGGVSVLFDDNDEVRDELASKISGDAYRWYPNVRLNDTVIRLARDKYYSGGAYEKVRAKVMRKSDEEAKKLLIELLEKNFEVGLKILMEG